MTFPAMPITTSVLQGLLVAAGVQMSDAVLDSWSPKQRAIAEDYAARIALAKEGAKPRPRPWFMGGEPPWVPICVRSRDGWCATRLKAIRYADTIKTICHHVVVMPYGFEQRLPDCKECLDHFA